MKRAVTISVNGVSHTTGVEPRTLLVHFLREQLGLTGTHVGCDTSSCGACTVRLDGDGVSRAPCSPCRPTAARCRRSRASPRTASCTRCSRPSTSSTACSAATARRA